MGAAGRRIARGRYDVAIGAGGASLAFALAVKPPVAHLAYAMTHRVRNRWAIIAAGFGVVLSACPADAAPSMSFRNNLAPGFMTRHIVARTTRRTTERKNHVETLVYTREAEWVRSNVGESRPGQVKVYQMTSDRAPKVVKLFRNKDEVRSLPPASEFHLLPGTASLHSAAMTSVDGETVPPRTDPVERAILHAMLDVAHWPRAAISPGHRWQRDLAVEGLTGSQTFEFDKVHKVAGEAAGRVRLTVEGKFTGALGQEYKVDKIEANIDWSRLDRCILRVEGQASYQRQREGQLEDFDLKVTVVLQSRDSLDEAGQDRNVRQLNDFASALTELNANNKPGAARACDRFRATWPDSVWMPAVEALAIRASDRPAQAVRLTAEQVREALAKAFVSWQAAIEKNDAELKSKTRRVLKELATEYRGRVKTLAESSDESQRAAAFFALAFGERPADLALVTKGCKDPAPTVRLLSVMGLIARKDPGTDPQTLKSLLGDSDRAIRRLACEAIAACIERDHADLAGMIVAVNQVMLHDKADKTRREAVRTIAALGSANEIPLLEKALRSEADSAVRAEIEKGLAVLRNRK